MEHNAGEEIRRELSGVTAGIERRLLLWLAARVPAAVGPDHLTALGLGAMLLAGGAYFWARLEPLALHAVNLCLALNWLGDSLDGTVARWRGRSRPRYGLYVDHFADALGVLALLGGLGSSGYMSAPVAAAVLIAYYLLCIETYLTACTRGVFRISYGPVGGTELRLLLAAANLWVWRCPTVSVFGDEVRTFDLLGAGAAAGLMAVTALSVARNSRALHHLET